MTTPRLPVPGGDDNTWGDLLNEFLGVEHNPDGTLKDVARSADLATKADVANPTFSGNVVLPSLQVTGLTGAVSAVRFVGGTVSTAPSAGTFLVGDFVVTQNGNVWVCSVAGSPGTWVQPGTGTFALSTDSRIVNAADAQTAISIPASTGAITLDCSQGYVWHGTITGNFSLNLVNLPTSGVTAEILVKLTQDGVGSHTFGGWKVEGNSITPNWDTGVAPTLDVAANATTFFNVLTVDGGLTLDGQGALPKIDQTVGDYSSVGQTTSVGSTGLAADAGHTHQGVSQLLAGTNITITGGDSSGHGALTISSGTGLSAGPIGTPGPADQGLIAWSYDVVVATSSGAITLGTIFLAKLTIVASATISNILIGVSTAGSNLTSGQALCGLYDSSGARLAVTADQSTSWTSTGLKTMALVSPQSISAGHYYIGILANGTSSPVSPAFSRLSSPSIGGALINAGSSAGSYREMQFGTSQTSLPSSITLTSGGTASVVPWVAVS